MRRGAYGRGRPTGSTRTCTIWPSASSSSVGLGARELGAQRRALRRQQLGADLEAQPHEPHDLRGLRPGAGLLEHLDVVRAHQPAADVVTGPTKDITNVVGRAGRRPRRGGADCSTRPSLIDHDLLGDLERLLLVVRDEDRRHVDLVVQAAQPRAQLLAHAGVERAERLVEQQHARLHGERAGQRHALALAAGELRRVARAEVGEPDELEQLARRAPGSPGPSGACGR